MLICSNGVTTASTSLTSTASTPSTTVATSVSTTETTSVLSKDPVPAVTVKPVIDEPDTEPSSSAESDSEDDGDSAFDEFVATVKADLKKRKANIKVIKLKDGDVLCCSHSPASSGAKVVCSTLSDSEDETEAEPGNLAFYGIRSNAIKDQHLASYMTEVWDDPFCLRGFISDHDSSSEPDSE